MGFSVDFLRELFGELTELSGHHNGSMGSSRITMKAKIRWSKDLYLSIISIEHIWTMWSLGHPYFETFPYLYTHQKTRIAHPNHYVVNQTPTTKQPICCQYVNICQYYKEKRWEKHNHVFSSTNSLVNLDWPSKRKFTSKTARTIHQK